MIDRSLGPAAVGELPNTAGLFIRGAFRCVITRTTPAAASAAPVSSVAMRPRGMVAYASAAYTMPSRGNSAAKRAAPCTLRGPSSRETDVPIRPCLWLISGSGTPPGIQLSGASGTSLDISALLAACVANLVFSTMFMRLLR